MFAEQKCVAVNHSEIVFLEKFDLPLEKFRQPNVVAVQKCDQFAACVFDSRVPGNCRAAVFLFDVNDFIEIFFDCFFKNFRVGRTVIDDNRLKIRKGLRQNRIERFDDDIQRRYTPELSR